MRRIMLTLLLVLSALIVAVGCAKYELPSPEDSKYIAIQPVDADENGIIDPKDIEVLKEQVDTCYQTRVLIYFTMAGIKVEKEEDIWKEENINILKNTLVVAEWERLTEGIDEWNKLKAQLEATERWVNGGSDEKPPISDSGVFRDLAWHPHRLVACLEGRRYILLTGIGVPNYASDYRGMSENMFYELTKKKIIRIEYDTERTVGDSYLQGYVYSGNYFVNAEMVARGYAKAVPSPPNSKYDSKFKKLEEEAKAAKRGIWAFIENEEEENYNF